MMKLGWGSHDLSGGDKFPGVSDYADTTGHPLPGDGVGRCQKALMGHGIPPNCAKHCHRTQEDLQPCCSMGTSMPSLLHNSSRCSMQAHAAHGWQWQLGVHLHPIEIGPVTLTPVQHGPHQHHDRWHPLHRPLQSTPPA